MKTLLILALIIVPLLLTALFYYFFREGTVVYDALGINNSQQYFFNSDVVNSLPSFAHVYSFSLVTWLVNGQKNGLLSALLWVMINIVFELGQALSNEQLSNYPEILKSYFANGSFNWFDIAAVLIGGLAAYLTMIKISEVKD